MSRLHPAHSTILTDYPLTNGHQNTTRQRAHVQSPAQPDLAAQIVERRRVRGQRKGKTTAGSIRQGAQHVSCISHRSHRSHRPHPSPIFNPTTTSLPSLSFPSSPLLLLPPLLLLFFSSTVSLTHLFHLSSPLPLRISSPPPTPPLVAAPFFAHRLLVLSPLHVALAIDPPSPLPGPPGQSASRPAARPPLPLPLLRGFPRAYPASQSIRVGRPSGQPCWQLHGRVRI